MGRRSPSNHTLGDNQLKTLKFKATAKLVEELGKEWEGEYEVSQLPANEYVNLGDELVDEARKQGRDVFDVPRSQFNMRLVLKACRHNGKALPQSVPSKLFEILANIALPLNTLSLAEKQELFLESENADPSTPTSSST